MSKIQVSVAEYGPTKKLVLKEDERLLALIDYNTGRVDMFGQEYNDSYWLRVFANEAMKGRKATITNFQESISDALQFLAEIKKAESKNNE